jgi:EAL domain-containing protein (putative c-di-GMP-specific phosphodiesterase class I)
MLSATPARRDEDRLLMTPPVSRARPKPSPTAATPRPGAGADAPPAEPSPLRERSLREIIDDGALRTLYQPIVDLASGTTVAYEALTRGPTGSRLELPEQLFSQAREQELAEVLDWDCQATAIRNALAAGAGRRGCLFINVEPVSLQRRWPEQLDLLYQQVADHETSLVVELTERALIEDPRALLAGVRKLRRRGIAIAIDDLGADPASLALLPFVEPDVIKLDLAPVEQYGSGRVAAIASAVQADAERRGALILAEGIETEAHADRAAVLGATLGQGWLFGKPEMLDNGLPAQSPLWARLRHGHRAAPPPTTPWELVAGRPDIRTSTKSLLIPMSNHIEEQALGIAEAPVLLAAFQDASRFTPATARRYAALTEHCGLVGVLGRNVSPQMVPGMRSGHIPRGHALQDEWTVALIGPHYAAALIALDGGDAGPEADRRFDYVLTHDRSVVVAAAQSLLELIVPSERRRHSRSWFAWRRPGGR